MPKIALGSDTNPGGRRYNEDRVAEARFATRGGLELSVGVVCDGVGGAERGERAAQLAIDTVLDQLRNSDETDVPKLLTLVIRAANLAALSEAQRLGPGEQMACTLAMAVVVNGETLHVANVGDSRIYLVRDGQVQLLTRDHTFENVMVWLGKLSPEAAAANPDANKVMRVLGTKENLQIDQGIYLYTGDYGEANRFGRQGFALQTGDSVLVCSDGLIKPAPSSGLRLVNDDEIAQVLSTYEGPAAARMVMSRALGRIPVGDKVDNISLALLQTEDPQRAANFAAVQSRQDARQRRRLALVAAGVGLPLVVVVFLLLAALGGLWIFNTRQAEATATALGRVTALALAQTETVAAYTATPTPVPPTATPTPTTAPTIAPGEVAKWFSRDGENVIVQEDMSVSAPSTDTRYLAVNHDGQAVEPGAVYVENGGRIQMGAVTGSRFRLRAFTGSDLFASSNRYANGARVELAGSALVFETRGCMAVQFIQEPPRVVLECYFGTCSVSSDFGNSWASIDVGQRLDLDPETTSELPNPTDITTQSARRYWDLLGQYSSGDSDRRECRIPPPPTPTPTRTRTPTRTPTPPPSVPTQTSNSGGGGGGGPGPQPQPSATRPPATATPQPSATRRPTNTSIPDTPAVNPSATPTRPPATSTRTPNPTDTRTPTDPPPATATRTNTPAPPTATRTLTPVPPSPTPTNTLVPTATDTLAPTATDTLVPTATDTLVPTATDTLVPPPSDTPPPTNTPSGGGGVGAATSFAGILSATY
jgi:serine/threonine protein phosphatase PrpC